MNFTGERRHSVWGWLLIVLGVVVLVTSCAPDPYLGEAAYQYGIPWEDTFHEFLDAFRVGFAVVGLLLLLAGFSIYEWIVKMIGFLTGGVIGAGIAVLLAGDEGDIIVAILGFLIGGGLGAAIALILTYLGVFFSGLWIGGAVFSGIWIGLGGSLPPAWWVFIGAALGGILMILLFKLWIMGLTAALGAALLGSALGVSPGWWVLFFLVGMAVQTGIAKALGEEAKVKPEFSGGEWLAGFSLASLIGGLGSGGGSGSGSAGSAQPAAGSAPKVEEERGIPEKRERQQLPVSGKPRVRAWLMHSNNTESVLQDGLLVGRSKVCDLQLSDPTVSRTHAKFRQAGEEWFLQDQDSSGGTYVNGQRVRATKLNDGDRIKIGRTTFTFLKE
jgi:hypothetical protein